VIRFTAAQSVTRISSKACSPPSGTCYARAAVPPTAWRGNVFWAVEFLQVEDPETQSSRFVELMDELKKKL
jgi:hypothetical protein